MSNVSATPASNGASLNSTSIPPLSAEEEDAIINTRLTNDERPLRRVIKKYHNYACLAHSPVPPTPSGSSGDIDEAREAFTIELASFQLSLKKSVMICEAEARQVEEYELEKQRIEAEHGNLKGQIEQLKTSLDHAIMIRKRKIEYDGLAEKINQLPTREELERNIDELKDEMVAIRTDHETQDRTIQGQKQALDGIISELGSLRFFGKENDGSPNVPSPSLTPAPESRPDGLDENGENVHDATEDEEPGEAEKEGGENKAQLSAINTTLDPRAEPFAPSKQDDDVEMGEVYESPLSKKLLDARSKRRVEEELEEGEASDISSALSEPPDD